MRPVVLVGALQLLSLLAVCQCRSGDIWTGVPAQCLSDAAAFRIFQAFTERHCSMQATEELPSGILVVQFRPASLQFSFFRYQAVCRDLLSAGASSDCRVLIRFPIKYPAQLSPKLTSVWLGDAMTRFENVVCQADEETNRIHPVGVQWTEDGAAFDGISSHLAMNKSDMGFSSSITVLLRMKRKPQVQPIFEFLNCANFATGLTYHHIWEYNTASKFYTVFRRPEASNVYMTTALLTANASEWINLGFTANATANASGIFLNDAFLPSSDIYLYSQIGYTMPPEMCFRFGMRQNHVILFEGSVKAIAIGSSFMTDSEIRDFFATVP